MVQNNSKLLSLREVNYPEISRSRRLDKTADYGGRETASRAGDSCQINVEKKALTKRIWRGWWWWGSGDIHRLWAAGGTRIFQSFEFWSSSQADRVRLVYKGWSPARLLHWLAGSRANRSISHRLTACRNEFRWRPISAARSRARTKQTDAYQSKYPRFCVCGASSSLFFLSLSLSPRFWCARGL